MGSPQFRTVRLRGRRQDCFTCSADSPLATGTLEAALVDYEQFCGVAAPVCVLHADERVTVAEYYEIRRREMSPDIGTTPQLRHVLLDVRDREHFDISCIPGATNVPMHQLCGPQWLRTNESRGEEGWLPEHVPLESPIYVICHVGNDSQLAVQRLKQAGLDNGGKRFVGDIMGGMMAWKHEIDPTIPVL